MEGRLTEEQVTKSIIKWLMQAGWEIISFDFPQSGTGRCLHPKDSDSKTNGIWIPDIVAHKGNNLVIFENKVIFVNKDFEKVDRLKNTNGYLPAIQEITLGYSYDNIFYGIGFQQIPSEINKAKEHFNLIDFLITAIDEDNAIVQYDPYSIFS